MHGCCLPRESSHGQQSSGIPTTCHSIRAVSNSSSGPSRLSLCLRNYWGINESYVTLSGLKMRKCYQHKFRLLSLNGHESAMRKAQRTHRYTQSQLLPPSHTPSMTSGGIAKRESPRGGTTKGKEKEKEKKKKNVTCKVMSYFLPLSPSSETLHNTVLHAEIKIKMRTSELFFSTPSFKKSFYETLIKDMKSLQELISWEFVRTLF